MFIPVQCSYSAFAETDSVVKTGGVDETAVDLGFHAHLRTFPPPVATLAVADALLLNGTAAYALSPAPLFAMGDIFSLSVLQILSVLSFLTSVLAVVCVGSGSLYRLSHKIEADVNQPPSEMNVAGAKVPLWNWSASFSLGSLIGDDDDEEVGGTPGYTGGSDLVRMDWHVSRPVRGTCPHFPRSCAPSQHVLLFSHTAPAATRATTSIYGQANYVATCERRVPRCADAMLTSGASLATTETRPTTTHARHAKNYAAFTSHRGRRITTAAQETQMYYAQHDPHASHRTAPHCPSHIATLPSLSHRGLVDYLSFIGIVRGFRLGVGYRTDRLYTLVYIFAGCCT